MSLYVVSTITFVLVSVLLCHPVDIENRKIEWIPVTQSQAVLMRPEPAGLETDGGQTLETFLCRGFSEDDFYPGKLVIFGNTIFCAFGRQQQEHSNGIFEMLDIPVGSTSWITLNDTDLYQNAVIGSIMKGSAQWIAYVCRAKFEDAIIPGYLLRLGDEFKSGACYIGFHGVEHIIYTREDIEVLVINSFGIRRGVTQTLQPINGTGIVA